MEDNPTRVARLALEVERLSSEVESAGLVQYLKKVGPKIIALDHKDGCFGCFGPFIRACPRRPLYNQVTPDETRLRRPRGTP